MNSKQQNELSKKDRIEILLKEYETLRSEILQRLGCRFGFLGLFGGLGAYMLFNIKEINFWNVSFLVIGAFILFVVWMWLGHLIINCSKRIMEIENQVNALAGDALLVWENSRKKVGNILHRIDNKFVDKKE